MVSTGQERRSQYPPVRIFDSKHSHKIIPVLDACAMGTDPLRRSVRVLTPDGDLVNVWHMQFRHDQRGVPPSLSVHDQMFCNGY